ncbi:MAG TPA: hypothetical protein VIA18_22075 [Polyangia bacterium]|jgi:hypothetical protein|nr:hypothetical protein [Polyangia bacterium]
MNRDPVTARDFAGEAAMQQELEAVWLDIDRAMSPPDDSAGQPRDAALPPAMAPIVGSAPVAAAPAADAGQLVHQRHDSSMLFSATMVRELTMSGPWRAAAPAARDDDASDTFVPIAVAAPASRYDVWMWYSLTVATATLLFSLVVAVDLLVNGR